MDSELLEIERLMDSFAGDINNESPPDWELMPILADAFSFAGMERESTACLFALYFGARPWGENIPENPDRTSSETGETSPQKLLKKWSWLCADSYAGVATDHFLDTPLFELVSKVAGLRNCGEAHTLRIQTVDTPAVAFERFMDAWTVFAEALGLFLRMRHPGMSAREAVDAEIAHDTEVLQKFMEKEKV